MPRNKSRKSRKNDKHNKTNTYGRTSWNPPNASLRQGALGKLVRPAGLVAACHGVPCTPRFCTECRPAVGDARVMQHCARCPHSSYEPGNFEPKIKPRFDDWLNDGMPGEKERAGQTYQKFVSAKGMSHPSKTRHCLYLCNMDENDNDNAAAKSLEILRQFVQLYFGMPCHLMEPMTVAERKKQRGRLLPLPQLLTGPLESILDKRKRRTKDAFAVVGVTMTDLTPDKGWDFVFGEADPDRCVGVFSFARYSSAFDRALEEATAELSSTSPRTGYIYKPADGWSKNATGLAAPNNDDNNDNAEEEEGPLVLLRAMKTLAHELGHLFGLDHCVFYQCVMNGGNSLDEVDESPLHLCPVCLRKLHRSMTATDEPWDVVKRYEELADALEQWGQIDASAWYRAAFNRCKEALEGTRKEPQDN